MKAISSARPTRRILGKGIFVMMTFSALVLPSVRAGSLWWRVDGTGATLTSSNWSTTGSAPFTNAWVNSSDIIFNATSAITNVTNTPVGNITLANGITVTWTAAGTFNTGSAVRTVTVGDNSTLTWNGQTVSTAGSTGFIKSGNGTWDVGAQGNAYTGGFTLNAGTVIAGGNNALGGGALTINGGIWQSSGTRVYADTSLVIGGDFTLTGTGIAILHSAIHVERMGDQCVTIAKILPLAGGPLNHVG